MNIYKSPCKFISAALILFISVALILTGTVITSAYSGEDYSIDIPDNWSQYGDNAWLDGTGNSINIQINFAGFASYDEFYSQKSLDDLERGFMDELESSKAAIKTQMLDQMGDVYSEEEINEYVDSIEIEEVFDKEITTFTVNDYPCLHMKEKVNGILLGEDLSYVSDQYFTVSGGKAYVLTITERGDSSEALDVLNSFTFNNYDPPAAGGSTTDSDSTGGGSYDSGSSSYAVDDDSIWENAMKKGLEGAVLGLVFGGAAWAFGKRKKKDGNNPPGGGQPQSGTSAQPTGARIAQPPETHRVEQVTPVVEPVQTPKSAQASPRVEPAAQAEASVRRPAIKMCPKCGKITNTRFCPACGTAIPDNDTNA